MSHSHLFCFAAKGLQSYIMRGGKLRDMVGATSLVDKLSTGDYLETWLTEHFSIPRDKFEILQAAAGSARIRFFDEGAANYVERAWPLWCHAWAPGLEVVQHLETWDDGTRDYAKVAAAAARELERARNFPAVELPEAGPFAQRAPRTGEAAVKVDHEAQGELIDLSSTRKRAERKALSTAQKLPSVADAFGFRDADELPDDFAQISGPDGAYLAVVHADGNRLGQMFLDVGQAMEECNGGELEDDTAIGLFQFLSQGVVAEGTRAAAEKAMQVLKTKISKALADERTPGRRAWPFAPLVLAGDDVTVVCRADLGLPFTAAFLKEFGSEMETRLGEGATGLRGQAWWKDVPECVKAKVPRGLSAGAGVVFCTDHYPFSLAYELCESVAHQAKNRAKAVFGQHEEEAKRRGEPNPRLAPPSALSFVRITGASAPTDFDDLKKGIMKGSDRTLLTGCPYFVGGADAPQYADLIEVYQQTRPHPDPDDTQGKGKLGLPATSLRGLLNLQRTDAARVPEAVERMKEVAGGNKRGLKGQNAWDAFEQAWKKLCDLSGGNPSIAPASRGHSDNGPGWKDLRFYNAGATPDQSDGGRSPLLDLLTLLAVRYRREDDEPAGPETEATMS